LFTRSLSEILAQEAGFDRKDLLIVTTDPASAGYAGARLWNFYDQLLERLRAQPGVSSASLSVYPPISGTDGAWTESIGVDGSAPQQSPENQTFFNPVSPEFFKTLGIRLIQGRDFGPQDNATGTRTVIVNEAFVRAYFPNTDPIGHHVSIGLDRSRQNLEIVGVVQDSKYRVLQEPRNRIAYQPWLQLNGPVNFVMEIRGSKDTGSAVRAEVRNLDSSIPVTLETVEDRIRESLVSQRVIAILSSTLGAIALLTAAVGLYGLMAYRVSRRTNELGLRMAVGASKRNVLMLVLRESLVLAGIGMMIGIGASIALGRLLKAALFGVTSTDAISLLVSAAIMTATALIASYLPALRASRVDPAAALRRQ
jgi:predicted permease